MSDTAGNKVVEKRLDFSGLEGAVRRQKEALERLQAEKWRAGISQLATIKGMVTDARMRGEEEVRVLPIRRQDKVNWEVALCRGFDGEQSIKDRLLDLCEDFPGPLRVYQADCRAETRNGVYINWSPSFMRLGPFQISNTTQWEELRFFGFLFLIAIVFTLVAFILCGKH